MTKTTKTGRLVRLEDGRAARIVREWDETTRWDGRNSIGAWTGDEFTSCHLGQSQSGAWIFLHDSQWQGARSWAEEVSPATAAAWFAACGYDLPQELESEVV